MITVLDQGAYALEMEIEREGVEAGINRYRRLTQKAIGRGDGAALKPVERLMISWMKALTALIRKEKRAIKAGAIGQMRSIYGPYLFQIASEKAALITMYEAIGRCLEEPRGTASTTLSARIGKAINAEVNFLRMRKERGEPWEKLIHTDRVRFRPVAVNRISNKYKPGTRWSVKIHGLIGATILEYLRQIAMVRVRGKLVPAITRHLYQGKKYQRGYIRLSDAALEVIEDGHDYRQFLRPRFQPMIVPPLSWSKDERGGYLEVPCDLVTRYSKYSGNFMDNEAACETINAVSQTPWRINKKIFAVMEELWVSGGNVAGLPRVDNLPMPPLPDDFETNKEAKKKWKHQASITRTKNIHELNERIVFLFKMDVAKRFSEFEKIYFPSRYDFRGRIYAMPLFLNHQGDDVCRGLLEFSEGKPVSRNNMFYVATHMANCCGIDKIPFNQRVQWINDNRQTFQGWIDDPLTNTGWMETDKPWQALAAAFALNDKEAAEHLPVQFDGSNNALQHYGAMLRCSETAKLVNLEPSESPADVYADVAVEVSKLIATDAANGSKIAIKLEGKITRKIVKQTVMTSVYGVTAVGARRQIAEQIESFGFEDGKELFSVSKYLSRQCLKAVASVCIAAQKTMKWIRVCGKLITNSKHSIKWETPLGLTIEQPYKKPKEIRVSTILCYIYLLDDSSGPISPMRQVNGFAPNFIHSLDASHLMCVAIACRDKKITFAGVHDSYWTHAATAKRMNEILREQFILMHEQPAHFKLYENLKTNYPDIEFPPPPGLGDFDISRVKNSRYFFA